MKVALRIWAAGEEWHALIICLSLCVEPLVPAQVELGLIWVWPETGPEALLESAAKQPALCQLVKDVDPGAWDIGGCCIV